jgi:prephenate dehydrogenase
VSTEKRGQAAPTPAGQRGTGARGQSGADTTRAGQDPFKGPHQWSAVSVVGVGLIGGSFALALRKAGFKGKIIGVSSPETIRTALDRHVIDEAMPLRDAAGQSDLIYLAQPISRILETLDEIDPHVYPGTLITDAGSTKSAIVARAGKRIRRGRFIGGHPMAGKQSRGIAEAEADLFRGRPYVLTADITASLVPSSNVTASSVPSSNVTASSVPSSLDAELERWIKRIGARVVIMTPEEHDRLVALTSHLPQLISTALASAIANEPGASRVAGPAAVDLTRLALSPYEIWRDIFATNSVAIDDALAVFIHKLEELRAKLRNPEIEREFERAASSARELRRGEVLPGG